MLTYKCNQSLGFRTHIKKTKYIRTAGISASVLLFAFATLSTFPIAHHEESAEATANPSTTTLEITSASDEVSVDLDVRDATGTFASSTYSSNVRFNVLTDNATGYSLSISGSDNTGKLVNTTIGTASIDTISAATSYADFSNSSNTTYNGKWGLQPSKYNSVSNSNYIPAPTTDSIIMDTTSGPNTSANSYSIDMGVRADYTTPSGTYTNTFVLQAVGRPVMYEINYLDTTEDATVANLPATDASSTSTAVNFTLAAGVPTRSGYSFLSWCDGEVTHTATGSTCDGDTYAPSDTYSFTSPSATSTNTLNLYAMWDTSAYAVTLTNTNATTTGSTSARVTYQAATVYGGTSGTDAIVNPGRNYTISGFSTEYNNASGATVSSTAAKTYSYNFDGWYTAADSGTRIITTTSTLVPSTAYTDAAGKWNVTSGATLYAHWTNGTAVTLPTISKTGHTCGWSTSNNTTTITYASGGSIAAPTANMTLYGVCNANKYNITIKTVAGVSKVTLNGTECTSTTGCTVSDLTYGQSYALTATVDTGKTFASWDAGTKGTITTPTAASTYYTVGDGASTITPSVTTNKYNITIKTVTGISKVTLNGTECTSTAGCTVENLTYGQAYNLVATVNTGYTFGTWNPGTNGSIANTSATSTTYTVGAGASTITPSATANVYNLTLTNTNATTSGSTEARVTYDSATVYGGATGTSEITNPQRSYTVSGFSTAYNNASGATVSSTAAKTYSYNFDGWYTSATAGDKIITTSSTLVPSTTYTNAGGKWTSTSAPTLYAHWTEGTAITLPTISKTNYNCGWSTSDNTDTITYASGYTGLVPTANMTLYGVCKLVGYTITFKTVDAVGIELDGTTYSNNDTAVIVPGTYSLRGEYGSRYAFSSWNATAGTISNANYVDYNLNTYTVTGDATITLTGQYVTTAIQSLAATSCTSTPMPTYDTRDSQVYWVKKLDDGNCWMMDNLNLGAVYLTTSLTSANTNLSTTVSATTVNGWRKNSGTSTYTSAELITLSKTNSATSDDVDTTSGTKLGTLYNYCAASAGTICTDSNSNNATYDICPSGWRLPKGGTTSDSTNEFNNLYTNSSYNTNAKMRAPVSEGGAAFALAGYFSNAAPRNQGSSGNYWSSVRSNNTGMYRLYLGTSDVGPGNYYYRSDGYSVRCIMNTQSIESATYMQDITTEMIDGTAVGQVATLKDKRDNEEYKVAKLADGKIWMLDNLRLDLTSVSLATLKGNTNATDTVLTYLKNGGGSSPYPASGVSSGWSSSDQNKYDLPYINTSYKNTVASVTYGSGSGKIGVYYNYCAASAGSYCYAQSAGTGNAAYDICPKNWRLPVGGTTSDTTNEFNNLYVAYGSDHTAFKEALSTPLSGSFRSGSAYNQGSSGYFWSSTFGNTYTMRDLNVNSSGVNPDDYDYRYYGFSVRCVVK